jgi:hypothetical protein
VKELTQNLLALVMQAANGEEIEKVVLRHNYKQALQAFTGKLLDWEQAKALLDYEFITGFGTRGADPLYAWTRSRIIFVNNYDGACRISFLPRNPVKTLPEYGGHDVDEVEGE